jgi:beta-galactosidase GanA
MKQLGQFIDAVKPLRKMRKGVPTRTSNPAVKVYHNLGQTTDASEDTHVYVAVHEPSNATTNDAFTFAVDTADGSYVVPQQGTLRLDGQDAKILLASYEMERQRLVYSTSELQTHLRIDDYDLALLYGRRNEEGETVLRFPKQPTVDIVSGALSHRFDTKTGDLRLNYTHGELLRVRISESGRAPLLLLIGAEDIAQTFWRQHTSAGAVLERGPALVRSATLSGSRLELKGDTATASELEIWAPSRVKTITWNDTEIPVERTRLQSLLATQSLDGASKIELPDLGRSTWKVHRGSPEAERSFDDSEWRNADLARTNGPTKPPAGQPVLTMDDYGFHHGDVWYRGRFEFKQAADTLTLHWGGGGAGLIQVWIDGVFVGQDEHATGVPRPPTTGVTTIHLDQKIAAASERGQHVIAVMVRNNSHNWDLDGDDAHKEGRGLISASLSSSIGKTFSVPIHWKIQGHLGAERVPDPTRGPLNNGGSFVERMGWHLPGFPTGGWSTTTSLPDRQTFAGTSWYRTEFDLAVPSDHDISLGLSFGDRNALRSRGRYRVLIFLNGWNVGQFIAHVGPQRTFILPTGVLNLRGRNALSLAVTSDGGPESYLERVELVQLHAVRGGVPVEAVASPSFQDLSRAFDAPSFSGE